MSQSHYESLTARQEGVSTCPNSRKLGLVGWFVGILFYMQVKYQPRGPTIGIIFLLFYLTKTRLVVCKK
jgi:hypothetical protein